jgi:DNA replication factor GINS
MNLEDLANKLVLERESDRLQPMDDTFYGQAALYVKKLDQARKEAADYKEAGMIDDEIKNARILIEGVFDRRMSKIIQYAAIYAAGTRLSVEGLTAAEKSVFDGLVAALERGRAEILLPALEVSPRASEDARKARLAKNILGGITTKEQPIENSAASSRDAGGIVDADAEVMTVKVLKDIPRFVGVDGRQYQLSGDDVVVLPKANALVLCNKNIAIPLQNP